MSQLKEKQLKNWLSAGKPIAGKSDGGGLTFTLSAAALDAVRRLTEIDLYRKTQRNS